MTRLAYVPNRIIDHNGISDGAVVHVYLSETTTPINIYSDTGMTVPMANPFTVAAGAAFPSVFYDSSVNIKLTIISALDGSIEEYDPYNPLSVSVSSPFISVKAFGAVGDGVTNDGAAFLAAIAALQAYSLNRGGVGAGFEYNGAPTLHIPGGHYYLGTTTLDINSTMMITGEGSGRMPAGGYGVTHLRWADGCDGIRAQAANTSGAITVDGTSHDGSGGVYISNLTMQGGYTGTDANHHAIIARTAIFLTDVLIRNWSGTGVKGWTGNVIGNSPPNYGGGTSVSRLIGVKVEGCQIATDFRGTDSNVILFMNCEAYQCRKAGFVDDNAAGANLYMGCHATYNGLIAGSGYITQVYQTGHFYAVRWGQEVGAATNAPSGTTADNTWWIHVTAAGAADSSHPQWTNGMANLASGGDYIMLSVFGTTLISCYVEGGGFSQLDPAVTVLGGSLLPQSCSGGSSLVAEYDGLSFKRLHSAAVMHFDGSDGALNGISSRDSTGERGSLFFGSNGADCTIGSVNGFGVWTLAGGVPTKRCAITTNGIELPTGHLVKINGVQVVAARQTGWTADTGTAKKTANATYTAGTTLTYSAAYVQAEQTAMATRVAALEAVIQANSQTIKALKDALIAHGLLGA